MKLLFQLSMSSVFVVFIAIFIAGVSSYEAYSERGFQPHPGYYRSIDQMADASERQSILQEQSTADEGNSISASDKRTQRFGISTYGGTGVQGTYPSGTGTPGLYGPVKIDLGGVLLGSLIGLGAILILPKLINAFSYGGGYGRSLEDDMNTFGVLLSKVEETLEKSNVDSSSCAQRITCSYVQTSMDNVSVGNATDIDRLIATMSSNSLVDYMLDGTAIKQAVELGKDRNTDCQALYPKCQLDKKTVIKILSNVIPS